MVNIPKKFADWMPPGAVRNLPAPGIQEFQQGKPILPYSEFKKRWKFRESSTMGEFPITEENIKSYYQDYQEMYKTKGKGLPRERKLT